jgi:hypothetical protein
LDLSLWLKIRLAQTAVICEISAIIDSGRDPTMTAPVRFPASFTPEEVTVCVQAYQMACTLLGLKQQDDAINQLVAQKVIKYGEIEKHAERICELVISSLTTAKDAGKTSNLPSLGTNNGGVLEGRKRTSY